MVKLENLKVMEQPTETPNTVKTKRNKPRIEQYFKDYLNSNSSMVQ